MLNPNEVGLLKLMVAYSALFAQFGTLGINGVAVRLFPFFQSEKEKHHGYLAVALIVGMVGFFLSTAILLLIKPWLAEYSAEKSALFIYYLDYLIPLIFFQLFFYILDSYYAALLNSVTGTFLREIVQRILIIVAIVLFYYDILSFHQFIYAYIIALCLPTFNILLTLIRVKQFSLKTDWKFLSRAMVGSMVSMSIFSILNGFSNVIIQSVDVIMLERMIDLSAVGIYSICFFFGIMVSLPQRSITRIGNIVAAQAWKNNDMETLRSMYYKSCLTLFILGSLLFLGLWANIDNVFHLLTKEYSSGKWVIFFIALGCLIDMTTGVNGSILGTSKYFKVQTVFLLSLVVLIVITNLILVPIMGMTGVAVGNAASMTILNILRYFYIKYKFGMQPFNLKFLYVILIGLGTYLLTSLLPPFHNYLFDIAVRGSLVVLLFCLPIYYFKISEDINVKADQFLRRFGIMKG